MALIHQATLTPTKLELLAGWLPSRDWYAGPTGDVARVAAFRFDDPAGQVGIETMLVKVDDGPVYQVPLTYRGAPLDGGEDWLIGTSEHSVLGKRWIYDACGDPVYAATLASAILANTGQAEEFVDVEGRLERRQPSMTIASDASPGAAAPPVDAVRQVVDGDPTRIVTDTVELAIARRVGSTAPVRHDRVTANPGASLGGVVLTGAWPGQPTPIPLASAVHYGRSWSLRRDPTDLPPHTP